ncbi:MAG: VanZ family protein [bacterium]|jgi:VanZ family protein
MHFGKLWPAVLWAVFILIITGTPGELIPTVTTFWDWLKPDKLVHLFTFGVLSFLILFGVMEQYLESRHRYKYVLSAVGISLAYGLLTEVLQTYVFIGRYGSVYDFLADALGAVLGWLAFRMVYEKKIKNYAKPDSD